MNCKTCRESLVSYLEKVPGAPAAEIERHLAECDACRGEAAAVRALRDRMVRLGEAAGAARSIEQPVMDRIAQHVRQKQEGEPMMTIRKRLFAHPWRLSAASILFAAIIGAMLVLVARGNRYTFAQTVEAHRNVRSVHVQVENGTRLKLGKDGAFRYPAESGTTEVWIEVGEDGKPVRIRADTAWSSGDGPYTVLWQDDKASVWLRSKKVYWTFKDANVVNQIPKEIMDPNSVVTALEDRLAAGKAQITEIKTKYEKELSPKVLVVNPPGPEGTVEVYVIDPKTKLLQEYEKYTKHGSELVFGARFRFTQYNEPIPESVFAPPALSADVMRLDQSNREIGVAQGKMSDSEVCEAAVRQFFECVIAKDYDKATDIWPGWGTDSLRERFEQKPVAKIISIGPAKADVEPGHGGRFSVPYEVEWTDGGRWSGTAHVKPWEGQPGRWMLGGGI